MSLIHLSTSTRFSIFWRGT